MTITYRVGDGLYINMTNRCTSDCSFCIRNCTDSVGDADSLWIEREPSREEILSDIQSRNLTQYSEIVFCGFGEPTMRLDDLLWLCKQIKQICDLPIRVNTNGHASLIAGYDTAPLFAGLVDSMNVSLNAASANEYYELCKPKFGIEAYQGMLEFACEVKKYVPQVVLSIVAGTTDTDACSKVADEIGLPLRIR